MLQAFKDIIPDISAIGMHSLRSGGATAALNVMATGLIEWFSERTGTAFENGARSKNAEKKLCRERRRVVLKSDLAREMCSKFLF